MMPADAAERCSDGSCWISVTQVFPRAANKLYGAFSSRQQLVKALLASCHLPRCAAKQAPAPPQHALPRCLVSLACLPYTVSSTSAQAAAAAPGSLPPSSMHAPDAHCLHAVGVYLAAQAV